MRAGTITNPARMRLSPWPTIKRPFVSDPEVCTDRLHRPLQGLDCDRHADLLSNPERPFTGAFEVLQGSRAIAFSSRLFCVGHNANRLVLLACPRGLAFHGVAQAS